MAIARDFLNPLTLVQNAYEVAYVGSYAFLTTYKWGEENSRTSMTQERGFALEQLLETGVISLDQALAETWELLDNAQTEAEWDLDEAQAEDVWQQAV